MPVNMSAQWVDRIRVDDKDRDDFYDSKLAGLGLRVSRTGKRVWFVKYRVKGDTKNRRHTLEPYPQMSLSVAREVAQDILLRASRGEDPAGKKQELLQAPTVKELAADYLERYAKIHKRSWDQDRKAFDCDVIPVWGNRKAHDIKRRDVIVLLESVVQRGSPIKANRVLALVRKMYNWAISQDIVESNPCLMVQAPSPEKPRDRVLKEREIRDLWVAVDEYGGMIGPSFKVRFFTAQRGGEVATMRWEDIDFDAACWTIPAEKAKNGMSHRVPLSLPVLEILREIKERRDDNDGGWVFRGRRVGEPYKHFGEPTAILRERSGVAFVPHDLRRTAASYMTSMGISRLVVSKILNHAEAGITRVYDRHSYDDEKRKALNAWAEKLSNIVKND